MRYHISILILIGNPPHVIVADIFWKHFPQWQQNLHSAFIVIHSCCPVDSKLFISNMLFPESNGHNKRVKTKKSCAFPETILFLEILKVVFWQTILSKCCLSKVH